ncbi:MAG: SH3 domain-containing protein [Oscillospiraceae bacterium]|nr:SH3 domain-containing protein [Oscillospiraceae bacterium]
MKRMTGKRIVALVLALCLVLGLMPSFLSVEAEAIGGVSSLTCSSFISNNIAQKYIDTMMRYHLNTNSTLQSTLNSGLSVVFMFEGGSDNYWNGSTYADAVGDVRNQAVCIVVQLNSSGNVYIPYYCENSSSIPDDPQNCTNGVAYSGATTVKDGIYSFYTWNHTGPYGAFQINLGQGYYTPANNLNGYTAGASGLNIHTRSTNTCGGAAAGWNWSLGCQVIGSGYYTGNEFNQFMKVTAGISYNVWLDYYNKSFNTITTGINKGYYVVDRQLGKMDINGKDYGSGSLIQLYNTTALTNITASSTTARQNAGFSMDYKDQCERFASYCTLNVTGADTQVRGAPCSEGADPASTLIETLQPGKQVTAVGIYKNLYGNYWYEVLTSSGKLGYIYSGNVEYVRDITTDIGIKNATNPDSHVKGSTFYVNGTISTKYNEITSVSCYIYEGFGEKGDPVTGTTENTSTTSYVLKGSKVDNDTWMGALPLGNYTYYLAATYANHYAADPTTLKSNTGTVVFKDKPFVVVSSAVDTATCAHTNTDHVIKTSTCLTDGRTITACSTCGLVVDKVTSGGHAYGAWSTTTAPTCTREGVSSRTCSRCGGVETKAIDAKGHSYSTVKHPATCQNYERYEYTCSVCGHNYSVYADEMMTQWSEVKPEGVDDSLMERKTQYRSSVYETITSASASEPGYTQIGKKWIKNGTKTMQYVDQWPEGFLDTHALYSKYDKGLFAPVEGETATSKTEYTTTKKLIGYVYYHWCYGSYVDGPINRTTSKVNDGSHTTFHAFMADLATMDPTTLTEASDGSMTYPRADACTDSHWWYAIPLYEDSYTTYDAQYTHERWTEWSEWGDTPISASGTRKVQERTVYRYVDAKLGDHSWSEGVCTVCGTACEHNYVDGFCGICGEAEPVRNYYLFGFINGMDYACEGDYMNMGQYLFVDGELTVTFTEDSYVGVKTEGNYRWYLTNGFLGWDAKSATLYDSNTLAEADKLFVPGLHEITFTLTVNEDGTLTLSYEITKCAHHYTEGVCGVCGDVCAHGTWTEGVCTNCGMPCKHNYFANVCKICGFKKPVKDMYLIGFINGADHGCEGDYQNLGGYKFVGGTLTTTFASDSYVAVKSHDNMDWYMTNGWLGYDVTAATLYNTNSGIVAEKLFVPGGREVTFRLMDNGNDTYTLSYVVKECKHPTHDTNGICTVCGESVSHKYVGGVCSCGAKDPNAVTDPGLALQYPTLSFEDEIFYNVYFSVKDTSSVEEFGLMLLSSRNDAATMADAIGTVPGYITNGSVYMVKSESVPAAHLGDTVYFKVYAKLTDGTYAYSSAGGYNAKAYANSILSGNNTAEMKALAVAMLNYGAEAQKYFGHNTDKLVNASLTDAQKKLVASYNEAMMDDVVKADSAKIGGFVRNNANFKQLYPSVSFDGAFAINFYCTPAITVDSGMTLYWWDAEDYANISMFTLGNATGKMVMTETGGNYWGEVAGIAAKDMDKTYYVSCVFKHNGTYTTTGIIPYSLGKYCEGKAAASGDAQQAFAQATVVYGYYAKGYFASIAG